MPEPRQKWSDANTGLVQAHYDMFRRMYRIDVWWITSKVCDIRSEHPESFWPPATRMTIPIRCLHSVTHLQQASTSQFSLLHWPKPHSSCHSANQWKMGNHGNQTSSQPCQTGPQEPSSRQQTWKAATTFWDHRAWLISSFKIKHTHYKYTGTPW